MRALNSRWDGARGVLFSQAGPTPLEVNSTQGWGVPSEEHQLRLGIPPAPANGMGT